MKCRVPHCFEPRIGRNLTTNSRIEARLAHVRPRHLADQGAHHLGYVFYDNEEFMKRKMYIRQSSQP